VKDHLEVCDFCSAELPLLAHHTAERGFKAPEIPLDLRILAESLPRLAVGGTVLLYTGVAIVKGQDPFLEGARQVLEGFEGDWHYEEIDPDVFGEDLELEGYATAERIAVVVLTATAG